MGGGGKRSVDGDKLGPTPISGSPPGSPHSKGKSSSVHIQEPQSMPPPLEGPVLGGKRTGNPVPPVLPDLLCP